MDLNVMIEKLKILNLKSVSVDIGVHYNTLYKIVRGEAKPNYATFEKIKNYLEG